MPKFFPERSVKGRQEDYERIVGTKIKLYVIKNIYNGKYHKNEMGKCPYCKENEYIINTDITRPNAIEFHHLTRKKYEYSARKLFLLFLENRANPHFLEDLISLMESERVELLCRSHHFMKQDKYFQYFKYLINKDDIFSLPPEVIHMLIITSVNNYCKTKSKTPRQKESIRKKIVRYLKKRFIIELYYGDFCHICGEFKVKEYLPVFISHHSDKKLKTINVSDLYDKNLPCSEILRVLAREKVGYSCANCHKVLHFGKHMHLLDKIFDDKDVIRRVIKDFDRTHKKFRYIKSSIIDSAENPLKSSIKIRESFERYLTAIYEISKKMEFISSNSLISRLGITRPAMHDFFNKNDIVKQYVNIFPGKGKAPTRYTLTNMGKLTVLLIIHFKEYYKSI